MTTDTNTSPGRFVATRRGDVLGITIPSGEFVAVEPIPPGYCPHGKYVGGCGIDWMCFACEMGDDAPDLTDADFTRMIEAQVKLVHKNSKLALDVMANDNGSSNLKPFMAEMHEQNAHAIETMKSLRKSREKRAKLATGPDDDRWWDRAVSMVTNLAYDQGMFDDDGDRTYTETDEIHEYGYVPEGGEI